MANTTITRRALVSALKELMEIKPFEKITISEICDKCSLNRKSFYYHFHDKYELMNWVFQSEFVSCGGIYKTSGEMILRDLCHYLYDNLNFYRQAFFIDGANGFCQYFYKISYSLVHTSLKIQFEEELIDEFILSFFSDGFVSAVKRWITDSEPVNPDIFVDNVFLLVKKFSK